jgi:SAM-dependent methyltransferase
MEANRLQMSNLRVLVDSVWRLAWESPEAVHTEELFVPFNPWREADLCPAALATYFEHPEPGARFQLTLPPGECIPPYQTDKEYVFPLAKFATGARPPRGGRFYPKQLLAGYFGNPTPFRCIGLENGNLTADFNHPLAGKSLTLEVINRKIQPKRGERGGECQDWLDRLTSGPGIQARYKGVPTDFFAEDPFHREEEGNDPSFYEQPRLVSHVDTRAQATIAALYSRLLRPGMVVLDLMSSWQSHFPCGLAFASLVGLGLNEEELRHNPRLTDHVIHDLNRDPRLPFLNGQFDAVVCNLSVEYLVRPVEVFTEVARMLKPGGLFVQTFSHRWFPPKVVKIWTELHEFERVGLVLDYFLRSGAFGNLKTFSSRGWPRPEDDRYSPQRRFSDPIYAVWGGKAA